MLLKTFLTRIHSPDESWFRRWDGQDQEVLITQHYSLADDEAHLSTLLPYFHDPRYICIRNKPLFLVYCSKIYLVPVPPPLSGAGSSSSTASMVFTW